MSASESLMAVGIGVSDLARSEDFYTRVLGMKVQQRITLPHMTEVILGYRGSASVVLMHWIDGSAPNYAGNPVKLVFTVPDAARLIGAIRAEGLAVTRDAIPAPGFNNMIIAMGQDPDGYVVEFIQAPA
jgi:catechol 2,3-dioxygenase-like lactoylglutathione lyase family enzyme